MGVQLARLVAEFVDLVVPRYCAGCGAPGQTWCVDCADLVAHQPVHRAVWQQQYCLVTRASYRQQWAAALVAAKSHGRSDLTPVLASYLAEAVLALPSAFHQDAVVVPVPSVAANTLRRGRWVMGDLAAAVAPLVGAQMVPAVQVRGRGVDQSGLSVRDRQRNARGRYHAVPELVRGKRVIIVDDIVTSGATAMACVQAVVAAGADQVAVAALALTPR